MKIYLIKKYLWLAVAPFVLMILAAPSFVIAKEAKPDYLPTQWSFTGPLGVFDRSALRRGYQVYREVCASCHAMKYIHFRNLAESGGLAYSPAQVAVIAAEFEVEDGPDREGDMFKRPARPSDAFPSPFANDQLARAANGGALPPDLSLIAKARFGGADYIYSLLQGYSAPPIGVKPLAGQYYNVYMGGLIAMAPPLTEEQVEYEDGTKASVAQMSHDVATFLAWAAEPHQEERKRIGFQVLIYLSILAALLFLTARRIWADQK